MNKENANFESDKFLNPLVTAKGEERAWVDLTGVKTLWFNTGTVCNITCANCYIESSPENDRLVYFTTADLNNYLDQITKVDTVVMDKTGTLTKGIFEVQDVVSKELDKTEFVKMVAALEVNSTHPIAQAIVDYAGEAYKEVSVTDVEEISGHGLKGKINQKVILAGNGKLLEKFEESYLRTVLDEDGEIVLEY